MQSGVSAAGVAFWGIAHVKSKAMRGRIALHSTSGEMDGKVFCFAKLWERARPRAAFGVIKAFSTIRVEFVLPLSSERRQDCADLLGLNLKTC